jgi:hypothetical protein
MNAHTDLYDQVKADVKGAMTTNSTNGGTRRLLARRELVSPEEQQAYKDVIYSFSCTNLPPDQICDEIIILEKTDALLPFLIIMRILCPPDSGCNDGAVAAIEQAAEESISTSLSTALSSGEFIEALTQSFEDNSVNATVPTIDSEVTTTVEVVVLSKTPSSQPSLMPSESPSISKVPTAGPTDSPTKVRILMQ